MKLINSENIIQYLIGISIILISLLCYLVGHYIEIKVILFEVLSDVITSESERRTAANFFAFSASTILLIVSIHIKRKLAKLILTFLDFVLLLIIFKTLETFKGFDYQNFDAYLLVLNKLYPPVLFSVMFYQLLNIFIGKIEELGIKSRLKQSVISLKQEAADIKQLLATYKQEEADIKQILANLNQEEADVKELLATLKQHIQKIKQEIEDRTCPHCGDYRQNKKSRDAHAATCSHNPDYTPKSKRKNKVKELQ